MSFRLSSIKSLVIDHVSLIRQSGLRVAFGALLPEPQKRTKYVTSFILAMGLFGGAGCAPVAPYERGKLAHPTMTAGDLAGFGESHLRAITEGAIGGSGGTGSGCGCN